MKMDVRILLQPGTYVRGGVRGQVVQHHMNVSTDMRLTAFFRKARKFSPSRVGLHSPEDLTGTHVQRCEQIRRTMPNVVMGAFLGRIERDRQHRLGPVQRLDLRLFIHRQHHRPTRRVQVQPHDIEQMSVSTAKRFEERSISTLYISPMR